MLDQRTRVDSRRQRAGALAGMLAGMLALALLLLARKPATDLLPAERQTVDTVKPQVCVHTLLENEVEEASILRSLELAREMGASAIVQFFP